jgi:ADP-ribose pyrophosphatase
VPNPPDPIRRELIHRGTKFDLERVTYRSHLPDGQVGPPVARETLRHPGSVIILPIRRPGVILLLRQFRPSLSTSLSHQIIELPAGTRAHTGDMSEAEDPANCAARELEEEAGYRAATLTLLTSFYTAPGLTNERMHAFVARDLTPTRQAPEPDEHLTVFESTTAAAFSMIDSGEIADAKTILTLLLAHRRGII